VVFGVSVVVLGRGFLATVFGVTVVVLGRGFLATISFFSSSFLEDFYLSSSFLADFYLSSSDKTIASLYI
jgi:hypothetical protein